MFEFSYGDVSLFRLNFVMVKTCLWSSFDCPDDQTRRLWSPNSSTLVAKLDEFVKWVYKNWIAVVKELRWKMDWFEIENCKKFFRV